MPALNVVTVDPNELEVDVAISRPGGATVTAYTTEAGTSERSLPATIDESTDFWLQEAGDYTFTFSVNDIEIYSETVGVSDRDDQPKKIRLSTQNVSLGAIKNAAVSTASGASWQPGNDQRLTGYLAAADAAGYLGNYAINLSESFDGFTFKKLAQNPVLTYTAGQWDDDHVKDPSLLQVDDTFYLFYAGYHVADDSYQIGLATSRDGVTFTKVASPRVALGGSGAWDEGRVYFPFVMYDEDETDASKRWKMWYSGSAAGTPESVQIGYATSPDGITWTKFGSNPVLDNGAVGAVDDTALLMGAVYRENGTYYLFYGAKGSTQPLAPGGDQVCLATFTDPEGTYTKQGVQLSPRTSATAALTANLDAGNAVVHVADSSLFEVGEYVFVNDSVVHSTQINRIKSIDSGTQLTLRDNASLNFTTARSARIRSVYYDALYARTVVAEPGGTYRIFGTAYNASADLHELSVSFTAPALAGPWEIDLRRGLIIQPIIGGNNEISSENPSIINSNQAHLLGTLAGSIPLPADPWTVDIDVFTPAPATAGGWTPSYSAVMYGGTLDSDASQNNYIQYNVVLSPGTWTIHVRHMEDTDRGIATFSIDGVDVGTIDFYGGGNNVARKIENITVAAPTGKHTLRMRMATKNASSSGYGAHLQHIQLQRTA